MLIDTHCHLHDPEWFAPEQSELFLQEAHANGVQKIICIGTNPQDSQVARDFANAHDDVYWTYGIHPEFATKDQQWSKDISLLFERIRSYDEDTSLALEDGLALSQELRRDQRGAPKCSSARNESRRSPSEERVNSFFRGDARESEHSEDGPEQTCSEKVQAIPVAIGEIGLDYHYDSYNRTAQIHLFEQMLQLATDLNLPVSLHVREAFSDALPIIDNFPKTHGVMHSFTGSKKDLRQVLERNFYVGVNGLCTYTTNPLPPLEKMVLETDAPFLTPIPFRGTINKPGYVKTIATYLAEKLGVAESTIVEQTTQNARNIFRI